MFERINFQGKIWKICARVEGRRLDDPNSLKESFGCDMVIRNNQDIYFILDEIIDAEYEDI